MTHPIYESTQLSAKSLTQLKEIAEAISFTIKVSDKRRKQNPSQPAVNRKSSLC